MKKEYVVAFAKGFARGFVGTTLIITGLVVSVYGFAITCK